MQQVLTFFTLGFSSATIYVGLALGLIAVYFSSGVLNLSIAGFAMWGGYVFTVLVTTGKLVFPIGTVSLGSSMSWEPALVIAVVNVVVLGAIVQYFVFRNVRRYSSLAQIVASMGVLITLVGLATERFGPGSLEVPAIFPQRSVVDWGGVRIPSRNLYLLGVSIVATLLLLAYFRWTTIGIATKASATNEEAVSLMGYSPQRLDAAAWAIASVLCTVLFILAGSSTLNFNVSYLVVPALAVMVIARMRSVVTILVAGVALASAQSLIDYGTSLTWWPAWGRDGLDQG